MMSWTRLLSSERLGRTGAGSRLLHDSTGRSTFQGDVDRITFAPSFRRLARKTQVFPLAANDHVHTRLTHSLEVSRVGRTLGGAVGRAVLSGRKYRATRPTSRSENDFGSVVEAASLAHDIGHPPFGHAGDRAFRQWFDVSAVARTIKAVVSSSEFVDLRNFDGNAQGFRRITQLEKNVFSGGLNLSYATLASYIKYPIWSKMNSDKSGFFQSERTIVTAIAEAVGLPARRGGFSRHPLSLLVEAADDTCYGLLDLEDAVEMEILPLHDVMETLLHAFAPKDRNAFRPARHERSHRVVFSRVRGKIFRQAIDAAAEAFLQNYDAILAGDFDRELLEVAAGRGNRGAMTVLEAKRRAQREVFSYSHKASIELASFAVIAQLLDAFSLAALQFSKDLKRHSSKPSLDSKSAMLLGMLGDHQPNRKNAPAGETWTAYQSVRRAIDYVAGMTDEFAIRVCRQLSGNVDLRA